MSLLDLSKFTTHAIRTRNFKRYLPIGYLQITYSTKRFLCLPYHLSLSQKKKKIEKLKGQLDRVEQLNLDLQQQLINLKKSKCSGCNNGGKKVTADALKGLATRITPRLTDDEVRCMQT